MRSVTIPLLICVAAGQTYDTLFRPEKNSPVGRRTYLRVTNIGEKPTVLDAHTTIVWWTPTDARNYDEWQYLSYGVTSDVNDEDIFGETNEPMTARRKYVDPQAIMGRSEKPGNPLGKHQGTKIILSPSMRLRLGPSLSEALKGNAAWLGARARTARQCGLEHGPHFRMGSTEEPDPSFEEILEYEHADEEVILHEGSDLFAEDMEAGMVVLQEVSLTV
ncbi:Eukaryotic/viral aspartic protease [Phytophthora megakarya]|uniref:Eukaryotic/viral aspartic protease n=1 Tax=Phytophthora megakarya TaxID=4795 RepID=A0A225W6M9_9STRA|nr:Eukaryotic/viral aspartic protease [Phytophthora megakarya]